ncbi:PAT family beta-lactamase induction signal transducer AmpG [Inhella inkyongensis]|uniref:PAT family beta-lactamase induction signal transducer AmpG n=1 Tax=Inhella inkyongensis TaxID=392593 RepID=A0A840S6Q6_9BURK|nr:MFS transporter [Inhella inkyongensis]MBB5205373.1 PAT family beta-lactamase induction signal transducer AmpG [Inhella inkyongensis]
MLPNLLATRNGRLAAFFSLYVTEGIPLGFAITAIATYLRRLGVGPAEIGAFVGSFYVPWAFKWAFGPLVDVFRSQRWGHRRAWILGTQLMMALTLASLVFLDLPRQLGLFTAILLVHNTFSAMQDVAIDSLACNTLREDERGLGNGMMFAGAAIGQAIGGSGVLFLTPYTGFQPTFFFVAGAILAVSTFIVLPMKEAVVVAAAGLTTEAAGALNNAQRGLRHALGEMKAFSVEAFRSFLGTRGAYAGLWSSLLPAGAMSLGLALQSNLAVELGQNDEQVATLQLWSNVLSAAAMILGGWMSDRLGRRLTLSIFFALMSVPVLYLAQVLQAHGYVMPRTEATRGFIDPALISALWVCTLAYNVAMGLEYGVRQANLMDVTNPKVAATQFTAYMAMSNLAIAVSATWQGQAIEAFGYPITLTLDAFVGLLVIGTVPLLKPAQPGEPERSVERATTLCRILALLCASWLPYQLWGEHLGGAQEIVGIFYTLIFVGGALVLLAGTAIVPRSALTRATPWLALALLALYARRWLPAGPELIAATSAVALAGAAALWVMARQDWAALRR